MEEGACFVGRSAELSRFGEILEEPSGQAVVILGEQGMGKSALARRITDWAIHERPLRNLVSAVHQEVTTSDSADAVFELMLERAYAATRPRSFDGTPRRRRQWESLIKAVVPKGAALVELRNALRRDVKRNPCRQFLAALKKLVERLPIGHRVLFTVDPKSTMQAGSAESWTFLVENLPPGIKFLLPQRPDDVLARSHEFLRLPNVVRLPKNSRLPALEHRDVEILVRLAFAGSRHDVGEIVTALDRYRGHPYAVTAAISLLRAGRNPDALPQDPSGVSERQWAEVKEAYGPGAIKMMKAYSVLKEPVPDEIARAVCGLDTDVFQHLQAQSYLQGLLRRDEDDECSLYHSLLAQEVDKGLAREERVAYHERAAGEYRRILQDRPRPDERAARRLAEHILEASGPEAFVTAVLDECVRPLQCLGQRSELEDLLLRALAHGGEGTGQQAELLGELAALYQVTGDLGKCERLVNKALELNRRLDRPLASARNFCTRALVLSQAGRLDEAEDALGKAYELCEQEGDEGGKAIVLDHRTCVALSRSDHKQALRLGRQTLDLCTALSNRSGEAKARRCIGDIFFALGDYEEALAYYQKTLQIRQEIGERSLEGGALGDIGDVYIALGLYEESLRIHLDSLKIDEEVGYAYGQAWCHHDLGLIHLGLADPERAERELEISMELCEQIQAIDVLILCLNDLSLTKRRLGGAGRWAEAADLARRAIEISRDHEAMLSGRILGESNLAVAQLRLGAAEDAAAHSERSVQLVDEHPTTGAPADEIFFNHWRVLRKTGAGPEANEWLCRAHDEVQRKALLIREPRFREAFLTRVPLTQSIEGAWKKRDSPS